MNREEWRAIRSHFEQFDQFEKEQSFQDLCMTLVNVFRTKKRTRHLVLNNAEEKNAKCVFLN